MKKSELKELIKECILEEGLDSKLKKAAKELAETAYYEIYEIGKSNGFPVNEQGFLEAALIELSNLIKRQVKKDKSMRSY